MDLEVKLKKNAQEFPDKTAIIFKDRKCPPWKRKFGCDTRKQFPEGQDPIGGFTSEGAAP